MIRSNNKQINSVFSSLEIVWFNFSKTGNKWIALPGKNRSKSSEEAGLSNMKLPLYLLMMSFHYLQGKTDSYIIHADSVHVTKPSD